MNVNKKTRTGFVPNATAVGRRIREVRGFDRTQEEFAQQLGVSQSQLSKYERGTAWPAADVLVKIKKLCGISIDWLLLGNTEDNV